MFYHCFYWKLLQGSWAWWYLHYVGSLMTWLNIAVLKTGKGASHIVSETSLTSRFIRRVSPGEKVTLGGLWGLTRGSELSWIACLIIWDCLGEKFMENYLLVQVHPDNEILHYRINLINILEWFWWHRPE